MLAKRRILELYLNVIEWGNGVFGAEAAARHYFGVSAAQLSAEQAARLAAMAPSPAALRAQSATRAYLDRAHRRPSSRACRGGRHARRSARALAAYATSAHVACAADRRTMSDRTPTTSRRSTERARARAGRARRDHRAAAPATAGRRPRHTSSRERDRAARARSELVDSVVTQQNKALSCSASSTALHPADIAYILEALPLDERLYIWDLVKADRDGEILLEVSDAVRESLISSMDTEELVAAAETLDADEIAELAPDLPQEVMDDVFQSLPVEEREQLRAAMSFEDDMVGALMDFEDVQVRPDVTLEVVLRYLRRFDELPSQTDQLFVVDRDEKLLGVLPLNKLIVTDPERQRRRRDAAAARSSCCSTRRRTTRRARSSATTSCRRRWSTPTTGSSAASPSTRSSTSCASAPRRSCSRRPACARRRTSSRRCGSRSSNRWSWLAINLVTAFIASRVIGVFEGSIEKLVALAALMPIVAGIGGNSGNQTITMIVRAAALGQVTREHARKLIRKEILVVADQRPDLGRRDGAGRDDAVQRRRARPRDGARDDAQPDARRADGRADPDDDAAARPRSGGGLVGDDHRGHRFRRLLHLPRAGDAVPDLVAP